jgi:hypothetical protein
MSNNKKETKDEVYRPDHYAQYTIEPIVFIMQNHLPFHVGNIVKYVMRAGHKIYENQTSIESEITDLKKAIRYCEMRINLLEGKDPNDV